MGKHTVVVKATDGAGNTTEKTLYVAVERDKTPPEILEESGSLENAPSGWIEQKTYKINVMTGDTGYGVTSVAFKMDGKVVQEQKGTCPDGYCKFLFFLNANMTGYKGGAHAAEYVVTDGAGNVTTKKWTVNVDPSGAVSAAEAVNTIEAVEETSEASPVAPTDEVITPQERADGNDPGLEGYEEGFQSTGTSLESLIPSEPSKGVTLEAPDGTIKVTEIGAASGSPPSIASEVASVDPNTSTQVDSVVRPIYDGDQAFKMIRDVTAPTKYSWNLFLNAGQKLEQVDPQDVAVFWGNGDRALLISAEQAHDATGKEVPTELTSEGSDVITLTVKHTSASFVYPVLAGPSFESGYTLPVIWEPPPPAEYSGDPEHEWTGYMGISPPEPIDSSDGEATASGFKGVKKHFLYVECSHNHVIYHPPEASAAGVYREQCGNPFVNDDGEDVAYRAAFHGKYFIKENVKVWHEGNATTGIGCLADWAPNTPTSYQKRIHIDRCVWWGQTKDGGGQSAPYGKHITPVGQFTSEERGSCGDSCPGGSNPWIQHEMPPMAYYLWASGHVGFHETTCVDC